MDDHETMLTCPCPEADRLTVLCLSCGRVHLPDPSYFFLAFSVFFFAAQAARFFL